MKKIIAILLVAMCVVPALFATRVTIPHDGGTYMIDTARNLTSDATYYLQGIYDGITCALSGEALKDVDGWLNDATFPVEATDKDRQDYRDGFLDIMANHTRATMGEWADIYPVYQKALQGASYEDAVTAVLYGQARFFLDLEPMEVLNVTKR